MANKIMQLKEEFSKKSEILENAKAELKKEFVGIDSIIDEIIENVRSWFILPQLQDKPAVINLFGLTGTGKTSLVLRLMELIDFKDKTYRFDLGEKQGRRSFNHSLSELCENQQDDPICIILDELQHARTLKGPFREEVEEDKNRMIWELIDSGQVSYVQWKGGLWDIENMLKTMGDLLEEGVRVANGMVIRKKDLFIKEFDLSIEEDQPLLFVQENEYDTIITLAGKDLGIALKKNLKEYLLTLDGPETIRFLSKVVHLATKPTLKKFTKSIIFIIGNLDEAYQMSGNFSADISADEFHELSLKITIPQIKQALRNRFRDEQIARLGNILIVYPALNSKSFRKLIQLELNRIQKWIKSLMDVELFFDTTLIDEIYKEGVYPTQGARPLFTTIHQMVKSKISIHFSVILEKNLDVDRIKLSVENGNLVCDFYNSQTKLYCHTSPITYNLEKLRQPKMNEEQAIAAVHEAGHAVLAIGLMRLIPEVVVSVTSDADAMGFMFLKEEKLYISKDDVLPKVAMLLGGIVAEELIFGENHLTGGGESDINRATILLMELYKRHGFGPTPIQYGLHHEEQGMVYHGLDEIESQIFEIMTKAKELAREELKKYFNLLLAIADKLSVQPRIERTEIVELIEKHSDVDLKSKHQNFYRNKLKAKVETRKIFDECEHRAPITLNKGK